VAELELVRERKLAEMFPGASPAYVPGLENGKPLFPAAL
jgi:hypothetical protein